ncbi:type II toxin-antitoxin system HigB family toxin [Stappia taiwanensis]|uniref:Type II toxin-antitoxin system HigB family toxin n=1 Tax=Stappia taiwanensis TaxID=992267 RepID=A0A838XXL8_9HYPH|nr:type II toxin-antitoxin system HigB family toxin [Stappia taiwanensis]MBA4613206.1 type II toxin-antitoxin system HigB family toxin [Stappia taiwanensis]GGE79498.1 hypothetical protein GCM10007285_04160 [Stappia taiwanensis]
MRIIKTLHLQHYAQKHPEVAAAILHWIATVKAANWRTPQEVQAAFSKAKTLGSDRVRFELAGGNYRLIAAFDFKRRAVFIKFIGTHEEYDKVDARAIAQY